MFESSAKPSLIIQYLETESGKLVKGGQFTLTRTTSPSETWTEIFTDDSGIAVVPNLEAGSYVLTQTKVPDGYIGELKSTSFTVNTEDDSAVMRTFYADKPGSATFTILDSQTGKPIPGVEVTLILKATRSPPVLRLPITRAE